MEAVAAGAPVVGDVVDTRRVTVHHAELTDIDAAGIQLSGLPALPDGVVTEGVDIILRVRSPEPA